MLEITVAPREYYDEANNQFITVPEQKLVLEHSLISLSKWESKWHKVMRLIPKSSRSIISAV